MPASLCPQEMSCSPHRMRTAKQTEGMPLRKVGGGFDMSDPKVSSSLRVSPPVGSERAAVSSDSVDTQAAEMPFVVPTNSSNNSETASEPWMESADEPAAEVERWLWRWGAECQQEEQHAANARRDRRRQV